MNRWRQAIGVAIGAAAPALTVACSLVVDTSGLANGPAVGDGGLDGAFANDAVGPNDGGGGDASPSGDSGSSWCAAHSSPAGLVFCEDFDSNETLAGFSPFAMEGTVGRVTDVASSPPASLLVSTDTQTAQAHLLRTVGPHGRIRVDADVRIDASGGGFANFFGIDLIPPPSGYDTFSITAAALNDKLDLDTDYEKNGEPLTDIDFPTTVAIADGQWHRCGIELDLTSAVARLFDGEGKLLGQTPLPSVTATGMSVRLGVSHVSSPGWHIRLDNVVVTSD